MTHKIRIMSLNDHREIEWQETFESTSKSGVVRKARRWMQKNLFETDIAKLQTEDWMGRYQQWFLMP